MSLDSRLRLARTKGTGARIHHYEIPEICEALRLLRACERAERSDDANAVAAAAAAPRNKLGDEF